MNKKLFVFGLIVLLVVGIAGCSGTEDDKTTPKSLYVEVSNGGGEANIFLLNSGNIIDYRQATNTAKFSDLSHQNYQVAVGREGYSLFKESVTVEGEKKLEVDLTSADSPPTAIEITAEDKNGNLISGFEVYVVRNGVEEISAADNDGDQTVVVNVWPGLIYDYEIIKNGHNHKLLNRVCLDNNVELTASLLAGNHIFSASETKSLNLGTLTNTAVIGITPLDLTTGRGSAGDTYSPTLEVTYESSSDTYGLKSVEPQKDTEQLSIETQSQTTEFYGNQPQVDDKLRELEEEFVNKYGTEGFKTNTSTSVQQFESSLQKGDERNFRVAKLSTSSEDDYLSVTATLKRAESNVYIFVDNDVSISETKLDTLANEFNDKVFTKNMNSFASDNRVYSDDFGYGGFDRDGNDSPIVLITPGEEGNGWLGFFSSGDYFSRSVHPPSNEADMFYVDADDVKDRTSMDGILGVLAHEFQHLIYFNEKYIDYYENDKQWVYGDIWANEGLSMLAMKLNGYYDYNTSREGNYLSNTSLESLLYWDQDSQTRDYGASGLFMYSLYDKFGIDLVKEIVSNCENPVDIISNYSAKNFEEHFLDWMLANHITNDSEVGSTLRDQYGYPFPLPTMPGSDLVNNTDGITNYGFDVNSSAIKYYRIEGDGSEVQLNISGLNEKTGVVIYRK